MTNSVGWLVGLTVGVAVSAASAAQAEPTRLADQDLDAVTAGSIDDLVTISLPGFAGSPAEGHIPPDLPAHDNVPDHAFKKHETKVFESNDGSTRTVVVTSYALYVDN